MKVLSLTKFLNNPIFKDIDLEGIQHRIYDEPYLEGQTTLRYHNESTDETRKPMPAFTSIIMDNNNNTSYMTIGIKETNQKCVIIISNRTTDYGDNINEYPNKIEIACPEISIPFNFKYHNSNNLSFIPQMMMTYAINSAGIPASAIIPIIEKSTIEVEPITGTYITYDNEYTYDMVAPEDLYTLFTMKYEYEDKIKSAHKNPYIMFRGKANGKLKEEIDKLYEIDGYDQTVYKLLYIFYINLDDYADDLLTLRTMINQFLNVNDRPGYYSINSEGSHMLTQYIRYLSQRIEKLNLKKIEKEGIMITSIDWENNQYINDIEDKSQIKIVMSHQDLEWAKPSTKERGDNV